MRAPVVQNKTIMVDRSGTLTLKTACAALRKAIVERAGDGREKTQARLRAVAAFEQAAVNAPQNAGWLRMRRIELREALEVLPRDMRQLSVENELSRLFREINVIVQQNAGSSIK